MQLRVLVKGEEKESGGLIPKSPFPVAVTDPRDPHLTQCVLEPRTAPVKWHAHPLNGLRRAHECDRRQTDHATDKWVAIGEIDCARAILHKQQSR